MESKPVQQGMVNARTVAIVNSMGIAIHQSELKKRQQNASFV